MPYATLGDLKSVLRINDAQDDALLTLALDAASLQIDEWTGTTFTGTIPADIKLATLIQASRLFARRNAPFGIAGSPDIGSELRLLARLDPDVEALLSGHRVYWVANYPET